MTRLNDAKSEQSTGYLLDTHVLIWSQESPEKLSSDVRALLEDPKIPRFAHAVSALEIARLSARGRIALRVAPLQWWQAACEALLAMPVPLNASQGMEAYQLPGSFHKDPCDRMLVAAARLEQLTLLTNDELILAYPHVQSRQCS